MKKDFNNLFPIALICLAGTVVYSNSFQCSFHLDDQSSIVYNFAIKNLHHWRDIWDFLPRHFVLNFTFALDHYLNGQNVFGYHLFNLMVHLLSAVLVWWLLKLTFQTPLIKNENIARHKDLLALMAGLIFVTHPVQTEAVTYIVQRAASMATMFYLASLCFYIKSRTSTASRQSIIYYISSLITAVMAMYTKEIAITLPLMILLYEYSFLNVGKSVKLKRLIPFFLTLLIIPLTILLTESVKGQELRGVIAEGPTGISPAHYLFTQFRVLVTYIRLAFFPVDLNIDYDYPVFKNIFQWQVLCSLVFLAAILYGASRLFPKYRLLSFSIFWFFLALLPESSLLPIKDVIFEHRLYLPLVGYSIFLVSALYYLLQAENVKRLALVITVIIACNAGLAYQRNKVYIDEFTLWSDAAYKSPHKARPYNGLGIYFLNKGDLPRALANFNKAIDIKPYYAEALNNRGNLYVQLGNFNMAITDFNKVIEVLPEFADAYYNRALYYDKQGDYGHAISDYSKAIELNPRHAYAYTDRAIDYSKLNDLSRAKADYDMVIEIDPNDVQAYNKRGDIYSRQGNFSQALSDFSKAIEINPGFAWGYYNRANTYGRQGNFTAALLDYDKAIQIDPKYMAAYHNRAVILSEFIKVLEKSR